MNTSDQYNIGINLLVNGEALEMFREMSKTASHLARKMDILTASFKEFNKVLTVSSINFNILDGMANKFSVRMSIAAQEMKNFAIASSRAAKEKPGFFATSSHHLARHAGSEMGTAGKLGMAGLMDLASGPAGVAVGVGAYLGVKGFDAQANYQRELAQISAQGFKGFSQKANAAAIAERIPMVTKSEYLGAIKDALIVTKDQSAALALAPVIAKMNAANTVLGATEGRSWTPLDSYKIARASEILSHSRSPTKIASTMQLLEKSMEIEGFKLSSDDIYGYAKRNAAFASVQDKEAFLANVVGIQQSGGHSWGTMGRSFTQMMLRGQPFGTGKLAMARQMKLGIMKSNFEPIDKSLLVSDPAEWIISVLNPLLNKAGYKTLKQKATLMPELFSGTSGNYVMETLGIQSKIAAVLQNVGNAKNIHGALMTALNLPSGAEKNLGAAWTNLMTTFGKISSPKVIEGMDILTHFLNMLSDILPKFAHYSWHALLPAGGSLLGKNMQKDGIGYTQLKSAAKKDVAHVYLDAKKVGHIVAQGWHHTFNLPSSSGNHTHTNIALQQVGNNYSNVGGFG